MKIERAPAPEFLRRNYKKWGKRYRKQRQDTARDNKFRWAQYRGQKVNEHLLPLLQAMTNYHCSFCDGFPLDTTGETIEHWRAVSAHPLLSHYWPNLFYCCKYCNERKGQTAERNLLKPDHFSYSFEAYFIYDYDTGRLAANPALAATEQEKVANTIRLYGLNEFNRPNRRRRIWQQFLKTNEPDREDFPYRFIFL